MGKVCFLVLLFAFVAVFVPSSGKGIFKPNEKLGLTRDNLGKVGKSKLLVSLCFHIWISSESYHSFLSVFLLDCHL